MRIGIKVGRMAIVIMIFNSDPGPHPELRLPGSPHQQVLQAALRLLQINRECENYAKRIDACSPYLYPHRGAGKCVNIISVTGDIAE